jgi:hypothetical protein
VGERKMATVIRAEISTKNKYWIDKHRHYELKHFCLQYPNWKRAYEMAGNLNSSTSMISNIPNGNWPSDPTAKRALIRAYYAEKMDLVEKTAMATDSFLYKYIMKAVTEGYSYTYLKSVMDIPCGRDMFYDRYRKFFWLLSESRN